MRPEVLFPVVYGLLVVAGLILIFRKRAELKDRYAVAWRLDTSNLAELREDLVRLGIKEERIHLAPPTQSDLLSVDELGHFWVHPEWGGRVSLPVLRALLIRAWVERGGFNLRRLGARQIAWEICWMIAFLLLFSGVPGGITSWTFWGLLLLVYSPVAKFVSRLLRQLHADRLALERTGSVRAVALGWGKIGSFGAQSVASRELPTLEDWRWRLRWQRMKQRSQRLWGRVDFSDEDLRRALAQRPLTVREASAIQEFLQ